MNDIAPGIEPECESVRDPSTLSVFLEAQIKQRGLTEATE